MSGRRQKIDWHFKCKVGVNDTRLGAGNYGRKINFFSSQQGGHRPALWLTITVRMCITVSDTRPGKYQATMDSCFLPIYYDICYYFVSATS